MSLLITSNKVTECGPQRSKIKTLLLQRFTRETDGQNTRDQITSDRRFKHASSNSVMCIPFILSGSPNECWLHTCDACVITTWRLVLRAPLVARNYYIITHDHYHYCYHHLSLDLNDHYTLLFQVQETFASSSLQKWKC